MSLKAFVNKWRMRIMGNPVSMKPLDFYVTLLNNAVPFSFSRFGDGEWNAVLGRPGANCDGHEYFPELGADLRQALIRQPGYFYGMQMKAVKDIGWAICGFLLKNRLHTVWHDADVFHRASTAGTLLPLVRQLRGMKTVVIGPAHLRKLKDSVFEYDHFIEIPPRNCYLAKNDAVRHVQDYYRDKGPAVFGFSASMAANVMIHELFPSMGANSWLIDFGSLWDPYVGVDSRGGKSGEQWDVIRKRNLGENA